VPLVPPTFLDLLRTRPVGNRTWSSHRGRAATPSTFGTAGKVTTDFAGNDDAAFGVALQTYGKIVAAGGANIGRSRTDYRGSGEDFALARYLA
jgi:hypothetical protein